MYRVLHIDNQSKRYIASYVKIKCLLRTPFWATDSAVLSDGRWARPWALCEIMIVWALRGPGSKTFPTPKHVPGNSHLKSWYVRWQWFFCPGNKSSCQAMYQSLRKFWNLHTYISSIALCINLNLIIFILVLYRFGIWMLEQQQQQGQAMDDFRRRLLRKSIIAWLKLRWASFFLLSILS